MTNKKISELVEVTTLGSGDLIPVVQAGVNKKITKENLDTYSLIGEVSRKTTVNKVITSDDTPTLFFTTGNIPTDKGAMFEVSIHAKSGSNSNIYKRTIHIQNISDTVSIILEQFDFTSEQLETFTIGFEVDVLAVKCFIVGAPATAGTWTGISTLTLFDI